VADHGTAGAQAASKVSSSPLSADDRLENVYGKENRRRLLENGTFNPDGSVNLSTAERLGWAQQWKERDDAAAAASEAARTRAASEQQ
jgi:hypothetical protein